MKRFFKVLLWIFLTLMIIPIFVLAKSAKKYGGKR